MNYRNGRNKLSTWSMGLLCVLALAGVANADSDRCPHVTAIGNFLQSSVVEAEISNTDLNTGTVTYNFSGFDTSAPVDGVPGLITYCVYSSGSNEPDGGATALISGANGGAWKALVEAKGSFSFTRPDGDPSNVPFDGLEKVMGTATWKTLCVTFTGVDPFTGLPFTQSVCSVPAVQTILLHINDTDECARLYPNGDGSSSASGTCWVFPGGTTPPPSACNGDPACKSARIDEATGDFTDCIVKNLDGTTTDYGTCPVVPLKTLLHIHYSYEIIDQATNGFSMIFNLPTKKTQDINSGGGKDYFGCEQVPDPSGQPKAFGTYYPFESTGMKLAFTAGGGTCNQSRFALTASGASVVLTPGYAITFTIDMITRTNKGNKQDYTSCGPHLLNSGFTVKWIQSDDRMLHSFTTGITPLYVFAGDPATCSY